MHTLTAHPELRAEIESITGTIDADAYYSPDGNAATLVTNEGGTSTFIAITIIDGVAHTSSLDPAGSAEWETGWTC